MATTLKALKRLSRERAAQLVAESSLHGVAATARKHCVPRRTLHRWRTRLARGTDPELAERVAEKMAAVEGDWAADLPGAIRSAIAFLKKAAQEASATDPDVIHSVAGALKILTEVTLSRRIIDDKLERGRIAMAEANARISRSNQPAGAPGLAVPAGAGAGASTRSDPLAH